MEKGNQELIPFVIRSQETDGEGYAEGGGSDHRGKLKKAGCSLHFSS